MRNYVTFRSQAFNTSEDRPEFLKPGHFGDDVAAWIADRLTELGWEVDEEISQEPLGWFITFSKNAEEFDLGVVSLNPEKGIWMAWLEQPSGFFGALFGSRNRDLQPSGPTAVSAVLENALEVDLIKWHTREQFIRGQIDESPEEATPEPAELQSPGYLS